MEIPIQQRPLKFDEPRVCHDTHSPSYNSAEEAIQHLRQEHFMHADEGSRTEKNLAYYVSSVDQAEFQKLLDYLNGIVLTCLETVRTVSHIGRSSLVKAHTKEKKVDTRARLTSSCIECFRTMIAFFDKARKLASEGEDMYTDTVRRPDLLNTAEFQINLATLRATGQDMQGSYEKARSEIYSALLKPPEISQVEGVAFGPDIVLIRMIKKLAVGPLSSEGARVPDIYDEALMEMVGLNHNASIILADSENQRYTASNAPRKRLIQEINSLEEELNALSVVSTWQGDALTDYRTALRSEGNQRNTRRQQLQPFEGKLMESIDQLLQGDQETYEFTRDQCGPLALKVKQSTEINEEDHGKAIFVFTVVTTIFLPLSFVTSFLGMNTTDIRDTTYSQSLFWMIALPVTAIVMALVMGVAYNSDGLKDLFSRFSQTYHRQDSQRLRSVHSQVDQTNQRHRGSSDDFGSLFPVVPPAKQPIYVKVHRDHLAIETLTYYGLPWEWDRVSFPSAMLRFYSMRSESVLDSITQVVCLSRSITHGYRMTPTT